MLYLYAVLETLPSRTALPAGIGGRTLDFVAAAGLVCATSETVVDGAREPTADSAGDPIHVLRHQTVLEALMDDGPLLPLRFGTLVADVIACRHLLVSGGDVLRAKLDQLRDCVEFAVRVCDLPDDIWPVTTVCGQGPGAAYLRTLAHRKADWPPASARFPHDSLAVHAKDRLLWSRAAPQDNLRASFLVRRPQISAFLGDLAALRRLRPDVVISCTGPWPPYSFADADLSGSSP
ncbi:MAG: gas vesicle protein [Proteobacteria bacterium]|nr:gas vesicle protein [Pseudomonadota bacterium]